MHRPEPPVPGGIPGVIVIVSCANKHTLTRSLHWHTPIGWAVAVHLAREKGFDAFWLAPQEMFNLAKLHAPYPLELVRYVAPADIGWQIVSEPIITKQLPARSGLAD